MVLAASIELDLLDLLESTVRSAKSYSADLTGRIAFGIWSAGGPRWWVATLGARVETEYTTETPEADALILMTGAEARRLATGQKLSDASRIRVGGSKKLIDRFNREFLVPQGILSLRATEESGR